MRKILLFVFLIGIVSSCTKPKNDPKPKQSCIVKSIQSFYNGKIERTEFYTYDSQSRVIRIDYDLENSPDFLILDYQLSKIVINYGKGSSFTVPLDAKGRMASQFNTTYTYNNEGYITETKTILNQNSDSETNVFNYQNGNLVRIDKTTITQGVTMASKTVLEYNTDSFQNLAGRSNQIFQGEWPVLSGFYGTSNKNMIAKITVIIPNRPDWVRNFTYQKDESGKITSMKRVESSNISEIKFIYECK